MKNFGGFLGGGVSAVGGAAAGCAEEITGRLLRKYMGGDVGDAWDAVFALRSGRQAARLIARRLPRGAGVGVRYGRVGRNRFFRIRVTMVW